MNRNGKAKQYPSARIFTHRQLCRDDSRNNVALSSAEPEPEQKEGPAL
jgi:hypothetical protein